MDVSSLLNKLFPSGNGGGSECPPWLVVGLGNPGPEYKNTRHNVGWWCLDELVKRSNAELNRKRKEVRFAEVELGGSPVVLAYPRTFMNRSGTALSYLANRFGTIPDKILIVTDDINLKPGSVRIRKQGGPGGHNGLKSIISTLGTNDFPRVRIGVGNPESSAVQVDHVLGTFDPNTRDLVKTAAERAADAITMIVSGDIDNAMNKFNVTNNGDNPASK
ncbi:MAG: aminoacyl-tRNA hydrolase [Chloroflexi bacterium]|nr:aminoacyl-tRNA hydrolase [Chloroflexota bacterium]MDA1282941.1 aminoacyl-tRNA hydrolase [Chloroflexota bacterium]